MVGSTREALAGPQCLGLPLSRCLTCASASQQPQPRFYPEVASPGCQAGSGPGTQAPAGRVPGGSASASPPHSLVHDGPGNASAEPGSLLLPALAHSPLGSAGQRQLSGWCCLLQGCAPLSTVDWPEMLAWPGMLCKPSLHVKCNQQWCCIAPGVRTLQSVWQQLQSADPYHPKSTLATGRHLQSRMCRSPNSQR